MGATNVNVATNGTCHVAPYGTTLPSKASEVASLNVAFVDCGEISQDGLEVAFSVSSDVVRNWQGQPIRAFNTENSVTFKLTFLEADAATVQNLYYGTTVTSQLGNQSHALIGQPDSTAQSFVISCIDSSDDSITTYVIPRGIVTDRGAVVEQSGDASKFEVTITALYDTTLAAAVNKLFDNDLTS